MKFDRIISFKTVVYKQNKTINNNILIMSKNEYALDLHIPSDEIYITTYPDDREYFIYFNFKKNLSNITKFYEVLAYYMFLKYAKYATLKLVILKGFCKKNEYLCLEANIQNNDDIFDEKLKDIIYKNIFDNIYKTI